MCQRTKAIGGAKILFLIAVVVGVVDATDDCHKYSVIHEGTSHVLLYDEAEEGEGSKPQTVAASSAQSQSFWTSAFELCISAFHCSVSLHANGIWTLRHNFSCPMRELGSADVRSGGEEGREGAGPNDRKEKAPPPSPGTAEQPSRPTHRASRIPTSAAADDNCVKSPTDPDGVESRDTPFLPADCDPVAEN
ncbi:hypothetical protein HPB47_020930 [Ixodes persulcatus]|uniref:Uncharacterized protein n=1 Tax=Ixodes persulcatus TaxID=34615 RepID=A0AC60QEW3_IXOPE|nr:hypothetical protein HPB47_020930 [Ixodes persulcatus]